MAKYRNGFIPKSKLIKRGSEWYGSAGTWAKWDALVADVKKNEGVTLRITPGENVYRDYASQVQAKKEHGKNAAYPGESSHGGEFKGKDALAIDVNNWMAIGKSKFYAYARKHGFEPGYFSWEPWHIIDWDPWRAVPTGGGGKPVPKPQPTPTPQEEEEDEMPKNSGVWYKKNAKTYVYLVFNTGSGFAHEFSNGENAGTMPGSYTAGLKASMDISSWSEVTASHANVIKNACAAVRPQGAPKEIEVTIVDPNELTATDEA